MTGVQRESRSRAEAEVVELVSTLIRFDTSNTGVLETTKGERECAQWVADQLQQAGYTTEYVESGAPDAEMCSRACPEPIAVVAR